MTSVTRLKSHQPPAMMNQLLQPEVVGTDGSLLPHLHKLNYVKGKQTLLNSLKDQIKKHNKNNKPSKP